MRTGSLSSLSPLLIVLFLFSPADIDAASYAKERAALVEEVRIWGKRDPPPGKRSFDENVLSALNEVRRHEFVPRNARGEAYANHPLPIGHGQTISQPYIVALMTDLVEPEEDDVVLEIGTGSGYQAAVLAKLVKTVYSIEIIEALAKSASERLDRLGYGNVENCGNGSGEPRAAAFDPATETGWANGHTGWRPLHVAVPAVD
jgi:protein-L-isoaspartate(D-aspartate) O-methyltransferase